MTSDIVYDFIVVGAGTAGCLLANRLSANPGRNVLLVEAGPPAKSLWVDMPSGVHKLITPGPLNWGFSTEPEPELENRRVYAPRGRGLGGSSLINGMAYFRAQPQDYDGWAAAGCTGWGWSEIAPLYRKLERRVGPRSEHRGYDGELCVSDGANLHPASRAFIDAGVSLGLARNDDFNGASAEGIGPIQFNIRDGVRHNAYKAFVEPIAAQRRNLTVLSGAQVTRVLLDAQRRATGVEVVQQGTRRTLGCRGEVIVAAGTFGSPHLLMHSGIGPADVLQQAGIAVVHALPGVGGNLQDHMYIHHTFACDRRTSMNHELRGLNAIGHGIRYLLTRRGLLTGGASQACAFVRSGDDVERADLQITFRPVSWAFTPQGAIEVPATPEFTASACNLRPTARGRVLPGGNDPLAAPKIHANYLGTERDREIAVRAVRWVRRILGAPSFAPRVVREIAPGPDAADDAQILGYIRRTAQSMHHWAGTCRMGVDADAVVDPELKVRGVQGLRVVDCSVLPTIVSANTNAAAWVVAEKAATLFR